MLSKGNNAMGMSYLGINNSVAAVFVLGRAGVHLLLQIGVQGQACEVGEAAAQRRRHVIVVLQVSKSVHRVVLWGLAELGRLACHI